LLDGAEYVVFRERVALAVGSPSVGGMAVCSLAQQLRAAQAEADVIPAAQARCQFQNLLFVAAVAVKEDQQWISIIRLVAHRQKSPDRQPARRLHFRSIESFCGPKQTPRKISVWHEPTYRARRSGCAKGMGCATHQ